MMKKIVIAGNWKMNMTRKETKEFMVRISSFTMDRNDIDVILFPPYTSIDSAQSFKPEWIKIGSQNLWYKDSGAFTGEISPIFLKELGVEYVLIGHSERRHILNEQDEILNLKVKSALQHDIIPIFCVGERKEENEKNIGKQVIKRQIEEGLKFINQEVILAYEPVWAIGTGRAATPDIAEEMHSYITQLTLEKPFTVKAILYGGSVNPDNISDLIAMPHIDGVLIGGASLSSDKFLKMLDIVKKRR